MEGLEDATMGSRGGILPATASQRTRGVIRAGSRRLPIEVLRAFAYPATEGIAGWGSVPGAKARAIAAVR